MKALVLGATGHVGNAIVRRLLDRGWRVTAASRWRDAANLEDLEVHEVHGDLEAPGLLAAWVAGHDLVVDAAAPYPLDLSWGPHDAVLRRAAARTAGVLTAIQHSGARLAYVSAFFTSPRHHSAPVGRTAELAERLHPYFACKRLIEDELLRAARRGLPVVVVNPTSFLGPWDRKPRELCWVPQVVRGELPLALDHVIDIIDVRDVAAGLLRALEAELWGEPILLTGHSLRIRALIRWVCEISESRPPRWYAPATMAIAPACLAESLGNLMGRSPSGMALAILLTCHFDGASSPALRELGLVPRPLSVTLRDTIAWYRSIGYC